MEDRPGTILETNEDNIYACQLLLNNFLDAGALPASSTTAKTTQKVVFAYQKHSNTYPHILDQPNLQEGIRPLTNLTPMIKSYSCCQKAL